MWGEGGLGYCVSPHVWASVGRVAFICSSFCLAASCRDVSPAHTPCMSAGGNCRA